MQMVKGLEILGSVFLARSVCNLGTIQPVALLKQRATVMDSLLWFRPYHQRRALIGENTEKINRHLRCMERPLICEIARAVVVVCR